MPPPFRASLRGVLPRRNERALEGPPHPGPIVMLTDAPPGALLQGTDTPEAGFERLAAFAARLLHAPISVISLVDAERPFSAGDVDDAWRRRREAPLSRSLCRFAVDAG